MFHSMPWKRPSTLFAYALTGLLISSFGCGKSGQSPEADMTKAAETAKDPRSAEALFYRSVEATGGLDALQTMTSSVVEGTFSLPAMGMTGALTLTQGLPGYNRMVVDIPGAGQVLRGVRGEVAWELSVMSGPRILEGAEANAAFRQADPEWVVNLDKYYTESSYAGTDTVGTEVCDCTTLITTDGADETYCFSRDTGYLLKFSGTQKTQMGDVESTSLFADYQDMGNGLIMAKTMTQSAMGMEQVISLDELQINVDLPEDVFDLPEEVEALLDK